MAIAAEMPAFLLGGGASLPAAAASATLMKIRIAQASDAELACEVLRRSIAECCYADHRNDSQILSRWLGNKTPETVAHWFASPANYSLVASSGNHILESAC